MPIVSLLTSLRSRLLSSTAFVSSYGANGFNPELVADFVNQKYTGENANTLTTLIDHNSSTAGNATMMDSTGYIKWRPHNLVPNSEDLSTSDWTGSQTTRTQVALSNPLGVTYVSQIVDTTVNSTHPVFSSQDGNSKVGVKYTAAMWAKAKSNARTINFQGFGNGANSPIFDLETGTLTATGSDWSDQSITDAGDGWYFITASTVATATAKFQFALRDGTTATYAGTGNHGVYIVGAHVYRSDLGGMADVPASERVLADANTYVRTAGREVTGIELVADTTQSGTITQSSASEGNPWFSVEGTGQWSISNNDLTRSSGGTWESLRRDIGMRSDGIYRLSFEVSDRTTGSFSIYQNQGTVIKAVSENGSYVLDFVNTSGSNDHRLQISSAAFDGTISNISVKEIDVDPSAARYLPRIGHHVYNGSQWVNEGLLHESGSRTNLFSDNHDLDGQGLQNATVTVDDAVSPTGEENAVALFETTANSEHAMTFSEADFGGSLTNGNQYTFSIFVKPIGSRNLRIGFTAVAMGDQGRCYFNLSDGTLSTFNNNADAATIEDVGNGWYRVSVTDTVTVASATGTIVIVQSTDASENEVFAGDTSSGLHLFGAQLEVGPTASSYIPTIGSTVTRAAETLTIEHENLPWSSSAVSIAMDGRMTYADTGVYGAVIPFEWKEDNDNKFAWELSTNSTDQGRFVFLQDSSSVRDIVSSGTDDYLPDVLVPFNLSSRYTSNALNAAIDGVSLTANTTPTSIPDLEDIDFTLGKNFMGTIGSLRIWANDIGDDGIVEATEPELQPTLSLSFDGTESSFIDFEWSE